ncbi:hypothetical protein WKI68_11640 [Streptomyces sp. MS1.HAVA.3]|uniref:Uncharacterized protein n=1 Tax=Streptomyces caledonius TaxID=3134107 RepID=A0ABU8U240_9ACTN
MVHRLDEIPQSWIKEPTGFYESGLRARSAASENDFEILEGNMWFVSPSLAGSIMRDSMPKRCEAWDPKHLESLSHATLELVTWLEYRANGPNRREGIYGGPPGWTLMKSTVSPALMRHLKRIGSNNASRSSERLLVRSGTFACYLRVHQTRVLLIGFALAVIASAFFGAARLALPSAAGIVDVPFRREIPVVYASLAIGSLHGQMNTFESMASRSLRSTEFRYLLLTASLAVLVAGLSEALFSSPLMALQAMRATLGWLGLAILSGRLWTWRLSWILPTVSIFPLVYYGHGPSGYVFWWDWTSRPGDDPASWGVALGLLAIGSVARWLTPWRILAVRSSLRR